MSICPRCGGEMSDKNVDCALSRTDNKTYICSPCGTAEGMYAFAHKENSPRSQWWDRTGRRPE